MARVDDLTDEQRAAYARGYRDGETNRSGHPAGEGEHYWQGVAMAQLVAGWDRSVKGRD